MSKLTTVCAGIIAGAALITLATPSTAQSIRAERTQPSQSGPGGFQQQTIPDQKRMACSSILNVFYTQRGIAFACRSGNKKAMILAIDHDKFPGGIDAAMTMLMAARSKGQSNKGPSLGVRYRAPTAKTQMICKLTGVISTIECGEVVALDF